MACVSTHTQGAYGFYLPEPLEPHCEHKESCSLRAPLLPMYVRGACTFLIGIDVLNQRPVVRHETRRLPSSPVHGGVMMQRKDVGAGVGRSSKRHVRRRAGEERARSRGQFEEYAAVVGLREVQRRDVRRPLRRRGVLEAVDADFAAVFERRDHVRPRRKERKVPDAFRYLVLLHVLQIGREREHKKIDQKKV